MGKYVKEINFIMELSIKLKIYTKGIHDLKLLVDGKHRLTKSCSVGVRIDVLYGQTDTVV